MMATGLIEAPPVASRELSITELPHAQQMLLATAIATDLVKFIDDQGLSVKIGGKQRYCMAEGWNFMGGLLGLFARQTEQPKSDVDAAGLERWWAHVEIVDRAGRVVSSAWHQCSRSEKNWRDRDSFALASMAATRATGKAYRQNWSWVMRANGFEPTPAEEMQPEQIEPAPTKATKPRAKPKPKPAESQPQQSSAAASKACEAVIATITNCAERRDLDGLNQVSGGLSGNMAAFTADEQKLIREAGAAARESMKGIAEAEERANHLLAPSGGA